MKISFDGLIRSLNIAEERISKFAGLSTETSKTESQQNIHCFCNNCKTYNSP